LVTSRFFLITVAITVAQLSKRRSRSWHVDGVHSRDALS